MNQTMHFLHKEPTQGSPMGREVYFPVDLEGSVDREYFWALPITDDTVKILNVPVFTHEFSLGDLVRVVKDGEIVEVLEKGPRTRLACYPLSRNPRRILRRWRAARDHLERHDIRCEPITTGRFAMAVPQDISDGQLEEICNDCKVEVKLVPPADHARAVLGDKVPRCSCCGRPADSCTRG